jgi:hypothetical protein
MTAFSKMSTGGEVANALVCKTSIHGFKSHPVLQYSFDVITASLALLLQFGASFHTLSVLLFGRNSSPDRTQHRKR